jgi:DNA primase catalytic core
MSQVDEVRAAADIVKVVGDYVKLRKAGANYMGLCPFHQEKTPSFAVHPAKQIFHCFGCGVGGDVFKFVMMIDSLTFPEALRRLAEKVGVTLSDTFGDETYDANARLRAALYKMHEAAAKLFAGQLSGTTEGRLARVGRFSPRGVNHPSGTGWAVCEPPDPASPCAMACSVLRTVACVARLSWPCETARAIAGWVLQVSSN